MNRPEIYQRSIDVLSRAYINGTLKHGACAMCAVGNLVAAALDTKLVDTHDYSSKGTTPVHWGAVHVVSCGRQQFRNWFWDFETGLAQLRATGYTEFETARIELAFETAERGESEEDWNYNGLMAVVEVLDKIHEVNDVTLTQESKAKFVKVPA